MSKKSKKYNIPTAEVYLDTDNVIPYSHNILNNNLLSANDIINRMKCDSLIMFKNIRKGIINLDYVFIKDDNCMCSLGWNKRPFVNKQMCNGCEMIRRVCKDVKIPEDKTITILTGKYEGKVFKVYEYEDNFKNYEYNPDVNSFSSYFLKVENNLNLLDEVNHNKFKKTQILNTNSYITNYINTTIFLNNKMSKYKMPNLIPFDWVYSCDSKVKILKPLYYSFMQICNFDSVSKNTKTATAKIKIMPMHDNIVISILKQLISILHLYSRYAFTHGRPCIEYLHFTNTSCNYKYGELLIHSPITLHLEPSLYTSFSYETDDGINIRLVNSPNEVNKNIKRYPYESIDIIVSSTSKNTSDNYEIPILNELKNHIIYCYKIGDKIDDFLNLNVKFGIPLLHTSFEFYCFMVSLLCEDSFYTTFTENETLLNIWYNLWKSSEYESMMNDLIGLKTQDDISYEDIVYFISNYHIRSDGLKFFFECVNSI